jgi:hypothetical protein
LILADGIDAPSAANRNITSIASSFRKAYSNDPENTDQGRRGCCLGALNRPLSNRQHHWFTVNVDSYWRWRPAAEQRAFTSLRLFDAAGWPIADAWREPIAFACVRLERDPIEVQHGDTGLWYAYVTVNPPVIT